MRITSLAIGLGLASLAYAQTSLQGLPDCAKTCVTQFTTGSTIGGCPSLDISCICASSGFLSSIACCLAGKCNAQDQATAVTFAQSLCKTSGVTNLPSAVVCASTASATPSSTTSNSASTPTTIGSLTSAATSPAGASTTKSATATAKGNTGTHNLVGIGAGLVGGLAVVVLI